MDYSEKMVIFSIWASYLLKKQNGLNHEQSINFGTRSFNSDYLEKEFGIDNIPSILKSFKKQYIIEPISVTGAFRLTDAFFDEVKILREETCDETIRTELSKLIPELNFDLKDNL